MPGHSWLEPSCAPELRVPFTTPSSPMAVQGVRQHLPQVDSDNLQLESPLDDGGSRSQVWAGSLLEPETGIRHAVAVKRFPPAKTVEDLRGIHREIGVMCLASQRSHRAARTWGWCQDREGMLCAVMKRYSQSLHNVIRRTKGQGIGLHATQRYGLQIATGVAELHLQNLVLSDVKPANILLDEFDNCALSDFGISTLIMGRDSDADGIHGTFQVPYPTPFRTLT
jgi:serine/threonine protein kinase